MSEICYKCTVLSELQAEPIFVCVYMCSAAHQLTADQIKTVCKHITAQCKFVLKAKFWT